MEYDPDQPALTPCRVNESLLVIAGPLKGLTVTVKRLLANSVIVSLKENEKEEFELKHTEYSKELDFLVKDSKINWWDAITPCVEPVVIQAQMTQGAELEIRFGKFIEPKITAKSINRKGRGAVQEFTKDHLEFHNGINKDWFDGHLSRFEKSNHWTNQPKWIKMQEFIFQNGVRMRMEIGEYATFIKKATIRNFDVPLKSSRYDLRVSLKTEIPTQIRSGSPEWIRLKERKSFVHKNTFQYDFTKVWEGKDIKEALEAKPTYELEIECINLSQGSRYLTESLLLKCKDLLIVPTWKKRKVENSKEAIEKKTKIDSVIPQIPFSFNPPIYSQFNPHLTIPYNSQVSSFNSPSNFINSPVVPNIAFGGPMHNAVPNFCLPNYFYPINNPSNFQATTEAENTAKVLKNLDTLLTNLKDESKEKQREIQTNKPQTRNLNRNILATLGNISGLKNK